MASKKKRYDLKGASGLRHFVEEHFGLRTTDKRVYFALQSLESQQDGFCKDVVANHRTIARIAKVDRKTVATCLDRLAAIGLIRYKPGSKTYAKRKASRIRRKPIKELKVAMRKNAPAYKLADILNRRPIHYGGKTVQPTYRVATTSRLYASKPDVQNHKAVRAEKLAKECHEGEVLIELDFRAAEPSVIAHTLGYALNGYEIVANAEGRSTEDIKCLVNQIVYTQARSTLQTARANGIKSQEALDFFEKVDRLREQFRRPNGKPVRQVTTLLGTVIEAPPKQKVHNGTLTSYYAQGSIADFINRAALEIISMENSHGWRFVMPCHDALYVIAKPDQVETLCAILLNQAKPLPMKIRTTTTPKPNPREAQKNGKSPPLAKEA